MFGRLLHRNAVSMVNVVCLSICSSFSVCFRVLILLYRSLTDIPDSLLDHNNEFNGLTSLDLMEGVDINTGVTPIKYMYGDSGVGKS